MSAADDTIIEALDSLRPVLDLSIAMVRLGEYGHATNVLALLADTLTSAVRALELVSGAQPGVVPSSPNEEQARWN